MEDLVCCVQLGPGWVDLTLATGARSEAEALAATTVELYGPRGLAIEKKALFEDVAARATALNADGPIMAAAFYSGTGEAVVDFVIDSYLDDVDEDGEGLPRPDLDEARSLLLDWMGSDTTGEPEVTYPDLEAGPTVRLRSQVRTKQLLGLWRQDTGSLTYAVLPPGVRSVVLASFTWRNMAQTEKVAELAGELMATLQVTPTESG
ncbi:hypothetical protein [Streptomyces sp. NPDC047315]|uniref:hypothetical protein n=1 Tax=Streptomyces sp. NPDC047315 TaxID=3155142 RepID=UPI003409CF78